MDMVVIACELVVAVCTLVYLFSLQRSVATGMDGASQHRRMDMAMGFLSLAFTLAVLIVTAIGADKLAQGAHAVWERVSAASLSVFGAMRRRSQMNTSVGVFPVSGDEAVKNQEAVDVS